MQVFEGQNFTDGKNPNISIISFLGLHEGLQNYRKSLQLTKANIQHYNMKVLPLFSFLNCLFCLTAQKLLCASVKTSWQMPLIDKIPSCLSSYLGSGSILSKTDADKIVFSR